MFSLSLSLSLFFLTFDRARVALLLLSLLLLPHPFFLAVSSNPKCHRFLSPISWSVSLTTLISYVGLRLSTFFSPPPVVVALVEARF